MANNTLFDCDAYWNDSWVQELDSDEERLYHFYITSPNLDKSGVYKQTERSVEFYVRGLGLERIREITEKFAKAKKVIRCGEWIIIPTTFKHQNYRKLPKVIFSVTEYLKKLPDDVFEVLRNCDYPLDLNAIRPPKEAETGNTCTAADSLPPKPDSLSIDYAKSMDRHDKKTDSLPVFRAESNSIQSNSIELNSIESELNINTIGGGNLSVLEPESKNPGNCENAVDDTPKPPPPDLSKIIKDRAKAQGFYLDVPFVLKIMKFIPDPAWFTDRHSVIDFAVQKIREDYKDKPKAELKRLFVSALTSWENIKDEYPGWLEMQTKADEIRELERLRKTPPRKCLGCGADLNGGQICGKCGGRHSFSGETLSWELDMPDPDFSIKKSFAQILKENRGDTGPPNEAEN